MVISLLWSTGGEVIGYRLSVPSRRRDETETNSSLDQFLHFDWLFPEQWQGAVYVLLDLILLRPEIAVELEPSYLPGSIVDESADFPHQKAGRFLLIDFPAVFPAFPPSECPVCPSGDLHDSCWEN